MPHLDHLADDRDVLSNDMGAWKYNGVDTTRICISFSDDEVESVEKCDSEGANGLLNYYMYVKRVYQTHATNKSLKKLTAITAYIYGN